MTLVTDTTRLYQDQFANAAGTLPGADLPWLAELRAAGMDRFAKSGLPTTRWETWKFTSLRPLEKHAFTLAGGMAADAPALPGLDMATHRIVLVDGRMRAELSAPGPLPPGVVLTGLADALAHMPDFIAQHLGRTATLDGHPLLGLNLAMMTDGVVLYLPRGTVLDRPVEIVFAASGAADGRCWHPRLLVVAEENAEATIVEHHCGPDGVRYFANMATEVLAAQGSRLHHYKVQQEGLDGIHLTTHTARLGRDATYDSFVLNLGGALSRHEARFVQEGTGITCHVSGAYAVRGTQHTDITTLIDHAKPHGTSREVVKGVIDGRARAVFQGKIIVRPDAQKTDGYQLNRALLLSDQAEIDSKPELEIYADDVKCSHGATAGELDEDQLFYLRARGVPLERARGLLIAAFLDEAMEEIRHEPTREHFRARVHAWMGGAES